MFDSLRSKLSRPIDIAPLVFVRILFGAVMVVEVLRYFVNDWIYTYFIEPPFMPKYYGFGWVHALPGPLMYVVFFLLGFFAFCIAIGALYRYATVGFFVLFSYVFLLDASRYLNHFYLISLVSFLLIFVPANKAHSIEMRYHPDRRRRTAPIWSLLILQFQIAIPYFFGGIAKLSPDWIKGYPMKDWLAAASNKPIIGALVSQPASLPLFVYGGIFFDLGIIPFMIWKRTRPFAFAVAILFHVTNSILFDIGIFPWFMLAMTAIFFPPATLRALLTKVGFREKRKLGESAEWKEPNIEVLSPVWLRFALLFAVFQILFPLRHFLYSGDVNWTEQGHRFSWHMKLRDKRALFVLVAKEGDSTWMIEPKDYIRNHQVGVVASWPDMIVQFAHFVQSDLAKTGHSAVELRARSGASLNGRKPQWLIDSTIDLCTVTPSIFQAKYIVPLTTPLPITSPRSTSQEANSMVGGVEE